jgi:hypothetical protein
VFGGLHLSPTTADVCTRTTLEPRQTLTYGFTKSGGFDGDDPNADDYKRFFEDPELRLTAGTWHVFAVADFSLDDCGPDPVTIRAGLTIDVGGTAPESPVATAKEARSPATPTEPTSPEQSEGPVTVPLIGKRIDLATSDPPLPGTTVCDLALSSGLLARNPRTGLGLLDTTGTEHDVIWPAGYTAWIVNGRADLRDESGDVIAHEGDRIELTGGLGPERVWVSCG